MIVKDIFISEIPECKKDNSILLLVYMDGEVVASKDWYSNLEDRRYPSIAVWDFEEDEYSHYILDGLNEIKYIEDTRPLHNYED